MYTLLMKTPMYVIFIVVSLLIIAVSLMLSGPAFVPYVAPTSMGAPYSEGMTNYKANPDVDIAPHALVSKVAGMDGIYESPNVNPVLDVFSHDKGDISCVRSGYSNQSGFLCITPEQTDLLQTRGGNGK